MASDSGELYFLGEVDPFTGERSPFVKIGLVRENQNRGTAHRLKEHQTGNPREITELHVLTTPRVETVETTMHGLFATHRIGGEWFRLEGGLLNTAIVRASDLAGDMQRDESVLRTAEEFAGVESSGEKRDADSELLEIGRRLALLKLSLKLMSGAEKAVSDALLNLHDAGAPVDRLVTVQTKNVPASFDRKRFDADHPGATDAFLTSKTVISGRFTPSTAKNFGVSDDDIERDIRDVVDAVMAAAASMTKRGADASVMHARYLNVLQLSAPTKFELGLLEGRLKAACGERPGIEGVCTWNRIPTEREKFDQAAFAAAHPRWFSAYENPETTARSVVVAKDLGYRL